jgi:aminoglycoside phosphotransferase (APT) family kinase protein
VEGIDEGRVGAWLAANVAEATPPFTYELIAGGRSNLTYKVADSGGRSMVLRRPPVAHVLPTAHDMAREHRIVKALGPTPVPVPPVLGFCPDPAVTGAPFYVMGFVEGLVARDAQAAAALDPGARRRAGLGLAEVLAEIHRVDVDAVGLGDLGRRQGYIARQLARGHSQAQASAELLGHRLGLVEEVHRLLEARVPPQTAATIVHGDYRLDNTVLGPDGEVRAVLDWEICTLGDPLADVGLLMVYWNEASDPHPALGLTATALEGFPSREEMKARYAARSGRDLAGLGYYVAFGYWKLACILEGVHARYAKGAAGGDRSGTEAFAEQVEALAEAARAEASGL